MTKAIGNTEHSEAAVKSVGSDMGKATVGGDVVGDVVRIISGDLENVLRTVSGNIVRTVSGDGYSKMKQDTMV